MNPHHPFTITSPTLALTLTLTLFLLSLTLTVAQTSPFYHSLAPSSPSQPSSIHPYSSQPYSYPIPLTPPSSPGGSSSISTASTSTSTAFTLTCKPARYSVTKAARCQLNCFCTDLGSVYCGNDWRFNGAYRSDKYIKLLMKMCGPLCKCTVEV